MEEKTDRRVRRTRAILVHTLTTLLEEKSIKDITVKELCELADINRGTFYLHYRDIYDMIEQLENDMMNRFEIMLTVHDPQEIDRSPFTLLYDIFQFIDKNSDLCKALLSPNGDISFLMKIKELFRHKCLDTWILVYHSDHLVQFEYSYNFIVAGCVGLIESWLVSDKKESPSEMAELANNIITAGIHSLM